MTSTKLSTLADRCLERTLFRFDCHSQTCCSRHPIAPVYRSYHLSGSSHGGTARRNHQSTLPVQDSSSWLRYILCRQYCCIVTGQKLEQEEYDTGTCYCGAVRQESSALKEWYLILDESWYLLFLSCSSLDGNGRFAVRSCSLTTLPWVWLGALEAVS
jgi:hypothetical protein